MYTYGYIHEHIGGIDQIKPRLSLILHRRMIYIVCRMSIN